MKELDAIDHKILYYMFLNSRQSTNTICRKVGISKSVFHYRLNRLESRQIIRGYPTVIDIFKLGYSIYRFNILMQFASPEKEAEIAQYFTDYDNSWNTSSTKGRYDLMSAILVKDTNAFYQFYEETLKKYRYHFKELSFSQLYETYGYRHSILLDAKAQQDHKAYELRYTGETTNLDNLDYKILCLLSNNARIPSIDIAKKLDVSSSTVINHIKKLTDAGIIVKYSANIDIQKLGFKTFIVNLSLTTYENKNKIIRYLSNNPFIWEIRRAIGSYDIELIIYSANFEHFHRMMEELRFAFPNDIASYHYLHVTKIHNINCLPQSLMDPA